VAVGSLHRVSKLPSAYISPQPWGFTLSLSSSHYSRLLGSPLDLCVYMIIDLRTTSYTRPYILTLTSSLIHRLAILGRLAILWNLPVLPLPLHRHLLNLPHLHRHSDPLLTGLLILHLNLPLHLPLLSAASAAGPACATGNAAYYKEAADSGEGDYEHGIVTRSIAVRRVAITQVYLDPAWNATARVLRAPAAFPLALALARERGLLERSVRYIMEGGP